MSKPGGDPSSGISSEDVLIPTERHPACRRREARPGFRMERENLPCHAEAKGKATSGSNREGESTDAERRDGAARSSDEGSVMGLERRGCVVQPRPRANWKREEPVDEAKPFKIPKREVWEAFKRVKANQGAAGVDGQSIAEFEADLRKHLHALEPAVLWKLLSSAGAAGDIPKANGGRGRWAFRYALHIAPCSARLREDEDGARRVELAIRSRNARSISSVMVTA